MRYFLLHTYGDVEPSIYGPYKSDKHRVRAARRLRKKYPEDGIYRINATGNGLSAEAFGATELGGEM